jgi:hypothetical protein
VSVITASCYCWSAWPGCAVERQYATLVDAKKVNNLGPCLRVDERSSTVHAVRIIVSRGILHMLTESLHRDEPTPVANFACRHDWGRRKQSEGAVRNGGTPICYGISAHLKDNSWLHPIHIITWLVDIKVTSVVIESLGRTWNIRGRVECPKENAFSLVGERLGRHWRASLER